jgi:hypothetical protein
MEIESQRQAKPFDVQRLTFNVQRSPFTVRRSPFAVRRSQFNVQRSLGAWSSQGNPVAGLRHGMDEPNVDKGGSGTASQGLPPNVER